MFEKFQEVKALQSRADEHLDWLRENVVHPDPDRFASKEGFSFVEGSGNLFTARILIVIGEFASCLRNALNYLTCALAEQDSGSVANSVQFPLESDPQRFPSDRVRHGYLKGIADEHVAFFEPFQPYKAGKPFELLREFTNAYRHRELIRVEQVFQRPKVVAPPSEAYRLPAGHVVSVEYFAIAVSLPDGSPIVETLEEIKRRVAQAVKEFRKPLARYVSENIEWFLNE
jgi:hypothetical protein